MATRAPSPISPSEVGLERALLFNFAIHALALLGMVALLLPTLPGGSAVDDAARIVAIAQHPWRFRLGWLPWQLCAAADLWLAIAMVRARFLPRSGSVPVLLLTLAAVVPDQYAQLLWVTRGVELAQSDSGEYLAFEASLFPLTAGWGAFFYTLAALGWTYCFARAGTWSRALTWLSVPLWSCMLTAVVSPLLPMSVRPSPRTISTLNGAGFSMLQVWLALVIECVLERQRPYQAFGRLARWRHPRSGLVPRLLDLLCNSRLARAVVGVLPSVRMQSDITDVIYVNYLLDAERVAALLPPELELQRLGPGGRYALFTFLTFQHHDFGFTWLGKLRRFFPSPVQSNWRVHVTAPHTEQRGIYFVTNAVSHIVPALGARLLTEGMAMHLFHAARIERSAAGALHVSLEPGTGTAPDAVLELAPCAAWPTWQGNWAECWPNYRDFLTYCVPQDRALAPVPARPYTSRQEIVLGIPLDDCAPLIGSVSSHAARAIAGDAVPLCFHVPAVTFRFEGEHLDATR